MIFHEYFHDSVGSVYMYSIPYISLSVMASPNGVPSPLAPTPRHTRDFNRAFARAFILPPPVSGRAACRPCEWQSGNDATQRIGANDATPVQTPTFRRRLSGAASCRHVRTDRTSTRTLRVRYFRWFGCVWGKEWEPGKIFGGGVWGLMI